MKINIHQYVLGAALLGCCLSASAKNAQFERGTDDISKSFNWYEPGLQEMLWEGQSMMPPRVDTHFGLDKRATEPPWWDLKGPDGKPLVDPVSAFRQTTFSASIKVTYNDSKADSSRVGIQSMQAVDDFSDRRFPSVSYA